ncbi:MAG TPA: hypothetical protein VNN17_12935, partial [Terriglobia bacterium]|nr:hypothetical protein [Terriglobia bacterium]
LVEIRGDAVVVDYQGLRTTVNVYQSAKSVIRAAATAAPAASRPAAAPAPVVDTAASRPAYPPSVPTAAAAPAAPGASQASPYPGVRMIIEGNRRRFERDTMFGPQVWYEDIK